MSNMYVLLLVAVMVAAAFILDSVYQDRKVVALARSCKGCEGCRYSELGVDIEYCADIAKERMIRRKSLEGRISC